MSKDVTSRESNQPVTKHHIGAMVVMGVIGVIVAFWILSSIAGIIFFFVKLVVILALIGGVFWLVSRLRK